MCELVSTTTNVTATFTNNGSVPSWSSSGTGFYTDPNPISGTAEYNFDVAGSENAAPNSIFLYAFVTGNGSCPSVTDSVRIDFTSTPTLTDLVDTVICYTAGVPINYGVSSGIVGNWTSTDATGTVSPVVGSKVFLASVFKSLRFGIFFTLRIGLLMCRRLHQQGWRGVGLQRRRRS